MEDIQVKMKVDIFDSTFDIGYLLLDFMFMGVGLLEQDPQNWANSVIYLLPDYVQGIYICS